ncbi:hypothetical protein DL93DRAFT_1682630 [Clavulina sp. PMI_390]|nr:hypothetical protein DL93DRAFT_1682630 [Clavulina sp. PMI_390]
MNIKHIELGISIRARVLARYHANEDQKAGAPDALKEVHYLPPDALSDFITHILGSSDPLEAHARIVELQRWQYKTGLHHHFLLIHCVMNVAEANSLSMGPRLPAERTAWRLESGDPLDFWLRIELSANVKSPGILGVISVLPPDDTVLGSYNTHHAKNLVPGAGKVRPELLSRVSYQESANQTSVRELARILDMFQAVSTPYILLTVREMCIKQ